MSSANTHPPGGLLPGSTIDHARTQRGLELVQWIAFACMLADHVGFFVLGQQESWLRGVGRLTFPLFGIVFGWRLADALRREPGRSLMSMQGRLLLAALLAQLLFAQLLDYGSLLNILFSFSAALAIVQLADPTQWPARGGMPWWRLLAAGAVLAGAGFYVDYAWPGVMMLVALYAFFRTGSALSALAVAATVVGVALAHPQHWAPLALPLAWLVLHLRLGLGRPVRYLFYWLYPGHLLLVWALRAVW